MDKQVKPTSPLVRCAHGHAPRVYCASANCTVAFFAECATCGIRSRGMQTMDAAVTAWNRAQHPEHSGNIIQHAFNPQEKSHAR